MMKSMGKVRNWVWILSLMIFTSSANVRAAESSPSPIVIGAIVGGTIGLIAGIAAASSKKVVAENQKIEIPPAGPVFAEIRFEF
ncbi:MAG: hypothetical protein JNL01_12870 [Bdellovibrionales bacterium]|nr:hypothetical protein [Bdellovibrionales bacterium]